MISASAEDSFPANASVDKLVESPGFHPGVLPVQVRPEVPNREFAKPHSDRSSPPDSQSGEAGALPA